VVDDVLFDQDPGATVHVNTVGIFFVAIGRIAARSYVVNQIVADHSFARLVDGRIGRRLLETDDVDSDVVIVVDNVVRDAEVRDIPVHHQRFARSGFEVMHLITFNDQVGDWRFCVGTVYGDAKSVVAVSWSVAAVKSLLNMMDVVPQQLYVGARSHNAYAQWTEPMYGGTEVANFKALDSDVTLIVNREYGLSSRRREMRCVKNDRFARIASKRNESIRRVAGRVKAHKLFVDSTPHVDGAARPRGVCSMLNSAPRRS